MDEKDEKEFDEIKKRELEQEIGGPWKWQIIRQLERIANACERIAAENSNAFTNEQQREAGRASAAARKARYGTAAPGATVLPASDVQPKRQRRNSVGKSPTQLNAEHDQQLSVIGTETKAVARRTKANAFTNEPSPGPKALIASYCEAFKARYGSNPPIDGKTAGLARNLLKTMPLERAQALVQAYCQMEDKWFLIKCHDFPTFTQSVTKVAVALFHGTADPHEKNYWAKVFGGTTDGHESLPEPSNASEGKLGGAQLQVGAGGVVLEELPNSDE